MIVHGSQRHRKPENPGNENGHGKVMEHKKKGKLSWNFVVEFQQFCP